jgi:hypothetical protein
VNLPLSEMTVAEKLRVMESPAWHEDELQEREKRIASGEVKFTDWKKAKVGLRQRLA